MTSMLFTCSGLLIGLGLGYLAYDLWERRRK